MNIFSKVLDELKYRIPQQVLREAFRDNMQQWRQAPVSVDSLIMEKVIKPRVLMDANIMGGQSAIVSLEGLAPKYGDSGSIIYEVPASRVSNREIISVLSIGYLPFSSSFNSLGQAMGTMNPNAMSDLSSAALRVVDSISNIPVVSTATADLIGYNTVLIRDSARITGSFQLRCMLANEENLNNINPRSYAAFSALCEYAVKSYIYNNMLFRIDSAFLSGGQELGAMKSYVETLADAEENYQTYLREVWSKVAFVNDSNTYTRFIRLQMNPAI